MALVRIRHRVAPEIRNHWPEGLADLSQPRKQCQTPSGVGCRRPDTPLTDCPAQPQSNSKLAIARNHRIDARSVLEIGTLTGLR